MVDPWQKSKKRLSGSSGAPSTKRLPNLTFYLDENWDCPEVTEELNRAGIRYCIYKQDVSPNVGTPDQAFLPKASKNGWGANHCRLASTLPTQRNRRSAPIQGQLLIAARNDKTVRRSTPRATRLQKLLL